MKLKILSSTILIAGLFISSSMIMGCNGHTAQENPPAHADDVEGGDSVRVAYVCPMHPEITGGENDRCSKCGMRLEPVKDVDSIQTSTELR